MTTAQEQKQKLEGLISTAPNPKQKAMYVALLQALHTQHPELWQPSPQPPKPPKPPKSPQPTEPAPQPTDPSPLLFSAVGILRGDVTQDEEGNYQLTINNKHYPLYKGYLQTWQTFLKEFELNGGQGKRLVVYPQVIHFPDKNKQHVVKFQLLRYIKADENEGIGQTLQDGEFFLQGLWQYIPVYRYPVCSIYKNASKERKKLIKEMEETKKARFFKAYHLPLFWKKPPVKPFRFNPKREKAQQGEPKFIQVKAKFSSTHDTWEVIEQLADPTDAPKYMKLKKKKKQRNSKKKSDHSKSSEPAPTNQKSMEKSES